MQYFGIYFIILYYNILFFFLHYFNPLDVSITIHADCRELGNKNENKLKEEFWSIALFILYLFFVLVYLSLSLFIFIYYLYLIIIHLVIVFNQ
jgi:hypothetical protein